VTIVELVAKLGFKMDEGSLEKANGALEGLVKAAKAVTAAFVGQEIFKGMREIATRAMEDAHAVEKLSERFGVSAEKLQELGVAAGDMGIEGVGNAMRFLSRNAYEASLNGGEVAETFRKLGVTSLRDTNGQMKTADVLMADVAEGMSKIHDPVQRVAMATKLFGREGANMVNMLSKGKKGLEEAALRAHKFGFVMSESFIKKGHDMHESQRDMDMAMTGLSRTIADELMPAFTWLYEKVALFVGWLANALDKSSVIQIVLVALGGVMLWLAGVTLMAVWPWLAMALGIAAVILVLDEIITSFRGGRTYLTDFGRALEATYDSFMKLGSSNVFISALIGSVKILLGILNAVKGTMFALVMAATGDFSGFKQVVEQMKTDFAPQISDAVKIGQGVASAGRSAYATASSGVQAASHWATMQMAPINFNQTINGTPGMDTTELGDKAAGATSDVLRQSHIEQAYASFMPEPSLAVSQ
jgi:hypothetical protein